MTRVVVTAEVEDPAKWEAGFRSHGDLFRSQPAESPYIYGLTDKNQVAVCSDVSDVDAYLESLRSQETADAMAGDGIRRDSVKVFVLDHEFSF